MEARCKGLFVAVFGIATILCANLFGATERSRNFVVTAPTPEIAKQIVKEAELCRYKLALEWLGKPLPNWKVPCTVNVQVGQIGAGGATTFVFDRGNVSDYKMNIQGPLDRILDSVLPHEVNHTIFAEHFRRPMPRWADEGAATFVEDESERRRQMLLAMDVLKTARRIPLKTLLSMMDYPRDMRDVLNLYAEGYVLTELLIQSGGRAKFLKFLQTANSEGWDRAIHAHYGRQGIVALDQEWSQWVMAGCPEKAGPKDTMLASAEQPEVQNPRVMARSQAPDREPVSVVDAAHPQPSNQFELEQSAPRRGAGLQAPPPRRGQVGFSEPVMLSQVDLGTEMEFVPPRKNVALASARDAKPRSRSSEETVAAGRRSRTMESDLADAESNTMQSSDEVEQALVSRPARPSQSVASAVRRSTLATPLLALDSRPQLGKSRPISPDDL